MSVESRVERRNTSITTIRLQSNSSIKMEKEIEMKSNSAIYKLLVIFIFAAFILVGCSQTTEEPPAADQQEEEVVDEVTSPDEDEVVDEAPSPDEEEVVDEGPRPDIIIAVQSLNDTHDPTDTWNISIPILTNIYDHLVERDFGESGLEAITTPGLAESWSQLSDTQWELNLREGVLFHDGTEMTAEDVVFTLSAEERTAIDWASMSASIESVEAVDTYTVRVTTKYPDAAFIARLQSYLGLVLPKAYYLEVGEDGFGIAPIGTGPYYQSEFVPLDHLTLTAFDDYWGGTPPVNTITFKVVPELSARIAGLLAGEFDIASGIPPDQMKIIEAAPDVKVVGSMVDNFTALVFRADHEGKPEGNQAFRQALLYALDREQLTDALWQGITEPPKGMQFRAFGEYYNPEFEGIEYDLDTAKELLAESGYNNEEIRIQFLKGYFPVYDQAMEFAQQTWTELGVNVVLEPLESWTLFDYDVAALSSTSFSSDIIDPLNLYNHYYSPDAWNVQSGIHTPTEEEVVLSEVLLSGMDFDERYEAFQSILKSFDEKALVIPFWYQYYAYGMQNGIEIVPYSNFGLDFRSGNFSMVGE